MDAAFVDKILSKHQLVYYTTFLCGESICGSGLYVYIINPERYDSCGSFAQIYNFFRYPFSVTRCITVNNAMFCNY